MRKLLTLLLLLSVCASAANRVPTGNASTNSGTNWTGGIAPNCTTDTITVNTAVTVTVPAGTTCNFGSNASGVGIGVNLSASGAKFVCSGATSVTFAGFDNSTNRPVDGVAGSQFDLRGCPYKISQPSDLGATPRTLGDYLSDQTTSGDTADAITWSNASGNNVYSSRVSNALVTPPNIYVIKMESATQTDPGQISNAAGAGLGSASDSSIHFTSGGFDSNGGTVRNQKDCSTVFASPFVGIETVLMANGDFCIDYEKGVLYNKSSSSVLTVTFDFKYSTWFGWSWLLQANAANSKVTLDGTYDHMGSVVNGNAEQTGGGFMIADKTAPSFGDTTRTLTFGTHLVFKHSSRPLQVYCQNITCTDATHHFSLVGAQFLYNRFASGVYQGQGGMIHLGYVNYFDLTSPVLDSFANIFDSLGRSNSLGQKNIITSNVQGSGATVGNMLTMWALPGLASNSSFDTGTNTVYGFQNPDVLGNGPQSVDGAFVNTCGNVTDGANAYSGHVWYAYRSGRLDEYCTVRNMDFGKTNHHGFILASRSGYFNGANITFDHNDTWSLKDANNFPGGCTPSYNQVQWVDSLNCSHGTYEGGTRSIYFNDQESSVTAITRFKCLDNILSNNLYGIYLPAAGATTNISNLGITQCDYNDDYNNTGGAVTNIKQGTFTFSGSGGANYNTSGSKTAVGAYVFNPSYSLPDATNRAIMETVSGTLGASGTKQVAVSWGGGTAVNFLATITAGGATSSTITGFSAGANGCPDGTHNCPVIADTAAAFPTSGTKYKTYFFMLTSGACSGKVAMIYDSTDATHLSVFSNSSTGSFASCTPVSGDSYIIVKPHQQLFDSGGTQSVYVQLYPPELVPGTNTTYTDSNINIAKNYPGSSGVNNGVNPGYVSLSTGNLHPTNTALRGTASDGTDIGAFPWGPGSLSRRHGIWR